MRLHRGVPMLAAVIALAGSPAASAYVQPAGGGGPIRQPTALTQHHSGDSIGWVIGIGTAGGLAVVGSGVAAKRSQGRKQRSAQAARAA